MMKVTSLALALVLVLGLSSVSADIGTCITDLTTAVTSNGLNCDNVTTYAKCILKESGFNNPVVATPANIALVKTQIEAAAAQLGVTCNIDVQAIVTELEG